MKKIITLLLIAIMLITTTASVFAGDDPNDIIAPMSLQKFRDVLTGDGYSGRAIGVRVENSNLGLQTVYKNISPDQIEKFRAFNEKLDSYTDDPANYTGLTCVGVTTDDIAILVEGIARIMTFTPYIQGKTGDYLEGQYKDDHLVGDKSTDNKTDKIFGGIDRASEEFYDVPLNSADTIMPTASSAADILNTISNNTLTKNALGGIVLEFKRELRSLISGKIGTFPSTFITPTSADFLNDPDAVKDLMKTALVNIFKRANPVTQLHLLKKGLETKGMLVITGTYPNETINVDSKFIQIIEKAFDLMNAVDGNYDTAATVANVNLAGVLDAQLVNPTNISTKIANPNESIEFTPSKNSVTFKVRPSYTTSMLLENLHLLNSEDFNMTTWFNYAVYKGNLDNQVDATEDFNILYNSSDKTITISTKAQTLMPGAYVLKLYRRVAPSLDYLVPSLTRNTNPITGTDLIKDLFIEIPMSYKADTDTPNPPGSGGGTTVGKKFTVNTKVSGTSGTGTEAGGTTVVTNSNGETGTFVEGTTVKILATAKPGFKFVGWSHDGVIISTDPEYTFVLGKDIDFIATFVKDDQLERVSHNWYLRGYPDGSFNADRNLTRAEMAMVLYRISSDAQRQNTIPENAFSDVKASEWYAKAITFLKNKNILNGYENGEFRPNAPVTRAEMATMVSRYDSLKSDSNNPFNDVSNEHWAYNYIISASVNNWIKGYPDSSFKPNGFATRAETATLVNRVLDRKIEVSDISKADTMQYTDLLDSHWGYSAIMEATHTHKYTRKENGFELWTEIVKPYAGFND